MYHFLHLFLVNFLLPLLLLTFARNSTPFFNSSNVGPFSAKILALFWSRSASSLGITRRGVRSFVSAEKEEGAAGRGLRGRGTLTRKATCEHVDKEAPRRRRAEKNEICKDKRVLLEEVKRRRKRNDEEEEEERKEENDEEGRGERRSKLRRVRRVTLTFRGQFKEQKGRIVDSC